MWYKINFNIIIINGSQYVSRVFISISEMFDRFVVFNFLQVPMYVGMRDCS
jgi:hypothetical protein